MKQHPTNLKKDTRVSVNVGPGVLSLSVLSQDSRSNVVHLADELEHGVLRKVLKSELALASVTGVGLAENGVPVARNDLAGAEGLPEVVFDLLIGGSKTDLVLHLNDPSENFLVGKTVERTGKTVETGGEGKVRIGQSTAHKVSSVGTVHQLCNQPCCSRSAFNMNLVESCLT